MRGIISGIGVSLTWRSFMFETPCVRLRGFVLE